MKQFIMTLMFVLMQDMTTIDWMKLQKEIQQKGIGPHTKL